MDKFSFVNVEKSTPQHISNMVVFTIVRKSPLTCTTITKFQINLYILWGSGYGNCGIYWGGGSIIQKIRKYASRLTDKNKKKQIFSSCIERMIGSSTTKLVSGKTRGGLLNATDGMLRIFAIMEKQFRTIFWGGSGMRGGNVRRTLS